MQGVWRNVHAEPPAVRTAVDEMSGLQKAGAQDHFWVQHAAQAQAAVHLGCEEVGLSGL